MSEFIANRMWPEALVERSIFGTDDPERIWQQVRKACPDAVDCFALEVSVGALFGLRLRDGSRVALKFHRNRDTTSLEAVQRRACDRSRRLDREALPLRGAHPHGRL